MNPDDTKGGPRLNTERNEGGDVQERAGLRPRRETDSILSPRRIRRSRDAGSAGPSTTLRSQQGGL